VLEVERLCVDAATATAATATYPMRRSRRRRALEAPSAKRDGAEGWER
jgi:hypothetical protein